MLIKKTIITLIFIVASLCLFSQEEGNDQTFDLQSTLDKKLLIEIENGDTAIIRNLLQKGANVNTTTFEGVTPLMYAVIFEYHDVAQLLVYYGADVNKTPYDEKTPLMIAAENDNIETGELLILNKADLSLRDLDGYTALHYAVINGNYYFTDMLIFYETDIDDPTKDGSSPLMLACYFGMKDIAELLIISGANIEKQDKKGFTPLMAASQQGFNEIVELLLSYGANTEVKNENDQTAICFAVKNGNKEIVENLIKYGANYNITCNKESNLISLAEQNNHYELKKYLKEIGIEKKPEFYFNKFNLNTGFNFSGRDILYELSGGLTQSKFKINANVVYHVRLGYVPVIEEDSYLLQLQENRSFFGFNFEKELKIYELTNLTSIGIMFSVKEMFSYGKYKAYNRNPKGKFIFSPCAGILYRKGAFSVQLQYQYLNTGIENFPGNRFSLTTGINFNLRKNQIKEKTITW